MNLKKDSYLKQLKGLILKELKGEKIKIFLFGSRAKRKHSPVSDVDIGFMVHGKIDEAKITILREKIENLNIPYKVEFVNFADVSDGFKKEAMKEVVVWKS